MGLTAADLAEVRAEAESRMRFACEITLPPTTDTDLDETGWPTTTPGESLYEGKCRFRTGGTVSGSASRDVVADRVFSTQTILSLPVSAPLVPVGAVVRITGVPPGDPAGHLSIGQRMRVVGRILGGELTAQRMTVEVVTG